MDGPSPFSGASVDSALVPDCRCTTSKEIALDTDSTAVVFIEFQNDFTSEGGVLHAAVKDSMAANSTLDNA